MLKFLRQLKRFILFYQDALGKGLNLRKTWIINFRFLPRAQAWKLPIFVYGKIKIEGDGKIIINGAITKGMIQMGAPDYLGVSNDPTLFYNYGTVIFNGRFASCNATTIAVHNKICPATIEFGCDVNIGIKVNLQAFKRITIGSNSGITHYTQVFDTNFHYIVDIKTGNVGPCTAPIYIGKNCWIGNHTSIMKGCYIPDGVIIAAGSLANKDYRGILSEYSVGAGCPVVKKAENKQRIFNYQTEQAIHKYFSNDPESPCHLDSINNSRWTHNYKPLIRTLICCLAVILTLSCKNKENIEEDKYLMIRKEFIYDLSSSKALDVTYNNDMATLRPVLIYVHGGNWCKDDKSEWSDENAAYFLENNIVSVAIDYTLAPISLSTDGVYPSNVNDVVNSIEWVRQNIADFGGDPNNVFLMGFSAGTTLANLAVLQNRLPNMKDYIRGVINLDAGPYLVMNRWLMKYAGVDLTWINAFGISNFHNDNLNPVHLITQNEWVPPFLLVCQNTSVRVDPNTHFYKIMLSKKHSCEIIKVENVDHDGMVQLVTLNLSFKSELINFVKKYSTTDATIKP